jgi:hypothetical protein
MKWGGARPPLHVAGFERCCGLTAVLKASYVERAAADCVSKVCILAPRASCSACSLLPLSCRSHIGRIRRCNSGSPPARRSSSMSPSPASAAVRTELVNVGRREAMPPACHAAPRPTCRNRSRACSRLARPKLDPGSPSPRSISWSLHGCVSRARRCQ